MRAYPGIEPGTLTTEPTYVIGLRFVHRDGNRILQQAVPWGTPGPHSHSGVSWVDVPLVEKE